jgi:TPR repeat protein
LKGIKEKAEAGDASSMRYLGTCFANGLGVPRDVEEAKRWFRRAAEAGSQAAREELAILQRQEK